MDETEIECPFCGEMISITIDTSISDQTYIEDCSVCCHPIQLTINCDEGAVASVDVGRS